MAGDRVRPIRRLERDDELECDRLEVIGYTAESHDGYRGPFRPTWRAARADLLEHKRATRRRP